MTLHPTSLRRAALALTLAGAAALLTTACGGMATSPAPVTVAELKAAAPTSATVDLDVGGASGMASTIAPTLALSPTSPDAAVVIDCHPHLFSRTGEVVWMLNAIFFRHLRHVEALIAHDPSLVAGSSATWTETGAGVEVQRQFTITRTADGLTYTFELQLAPAGQTPPVWVTVFNGTLTKAVTTTGRDQTAAMTFDYTALNSVLPTELLTGKIDVSWERLVDSTKPAPGRKKTTTIAFDHFLVAGDPHGPRTGTFTHVGEPNVGGSLSFQDSLVLLCPANPGDLEADTTTQSRWFIAADGSVHGRADAKATGGQMPAGDTWEGVTCFQGSRDTLLMPTAETAYWAMKEEDATGATVAGTAQSVGVGATACDPLFGPVPSLTDNASDYGFPAGPVSFPNEW